MVSISLCMIVKNEEKVICRCLDCVKNVADEIIIVDTGSSDRTKKLARAYTKMIYDFAWIDDFAAARNFSFSKASKDYILWLDADDVIDAENQAALRLLKKTLDPQADIVMMQYHIAFDAAQNPTFTYERERLLKRKKNFLWQGEVHEVIVPAGHIIHSDIAIRHEKLGAGDPKRNLKIYQKMLSDGKPFSPRQKYYYARELYYNGQYQEAAVELENYLDGEGWVEDKINACKVLAECYGLLDQKQPELLALLRSFQFDAPRAELCCEIGRYFLENQKYACAIFWYELAAGREILEGNSGFHEPDCYGYIPFIQLCVCYDRLGQKKIAREYNERAGQIKPLDPGYLYNKSYFDQISESPDMTKEE